MTGCSSKLFSDLAGGVLFLGTSQMFEICPLSRALSLLARPQSHLKRKNSLRRYLRVSFSGAWCHRARRLLRIMTLQSARPQSGGGSGMWCRVVNLKRWRLCVHLCCRTRVTERICQSASVPEQDTKTVSVPDLTLDLCCLCSEEWWGSECAFRPDIYSRAETKSRSINESINRKCICNNRDNHFIIQSASFTSFSGLFL